MKERLKYLNEKETLYQLSERILNKYPNKRIWILLNGKVLARFKNSTDLYLNHTNFLGYVNVKKVQLVEEDIAIEFDSVSFINTFNLL